MKTISLLLITGALLAAQNEAQKPGFVNTDPKPAEKPPVISDKLQLEMTRLNLASVQLNAQVKDLVQQQFGKKIAELEERRTALSSEIVKACNTDPATGKSLGDKNTAQMNGDNIECVAKPQGAPPTPSAPSK